MMVTTSLKKHNRIKIKIKEGPHKFQLEVAGKLEAP